MLGCLWATPKGERVIYEAAVYFSAADEDCMPVPEIADRLNRAPSTGLSDDLGEGTDTTAEAASKGRCTV